jgi:hypothetical protein
VEADLEIAATQRKTPGQEGNAMVGIAEIKAGLESIKLAGDIAQGLGALTSKADREAKLADLSREIATAYQSVVTAALSEAAMLQENQDLKRELAQLKDNKAELEKYELLEPVRGVFVRSIKESARGVEPPHWACDTCHREGKIRILNSTGKLSHSRHTVLECSGCGRGYNCGVPRDLPRVQRQPNYSVFGEE